jgi:hypothetical protein
MMITDERKRRGERDEGREAQWKQRRTDDSELKKTRIEIPGLY